MKKPLLVAICFASIFVTGFLWINPPASSSKDITDKISWYKMEEAQKLASSGDKKVLIYAGASWCGYCKKMEEEVFTRKDVRQIMSEFYYPVRIDIESDNIIKFNGKEITEQEFSTAMQISATPTFLFIEGNGTILGNQPGYMPADIFKALLSYVGSGAYSKMGFDVYYEYESGSEN